MKYSIELISDDDRDVDLFIDLERVWLDSVAATHKFLTADQILSLRDDLRLGLEHVESLVVVLEDDDPVGFVGVDDDKIEMLFLAPELFGKGFGGELLRVAVDQLGATKVDVNEQNPRALAFYTHAGFEPYERCDTDDQGNPYPIIRMTLN